MPFGTDQAWGVILPQERTNLFRNPSLERTTTDWNDPSVGFIAGRVSDTQAFGAYCAATPGNTGGPVLGCTVGPWTAGVGTAYTVSLYMRSANTESIRLGVANGADVTTPPTYLGTTDVTVGGGTWHRHSFAYTEASGGSRYMSIIVADTALSGTLYMDGAMVEAGSLTTYIDGDQAGCYWTGAPHLSASVRSGTSRAGGTLVALADLGFRVETSPGIGMPPLETTGQSFALTDGAQFQRQRAGRRTFTLAGYVQGTTTQTRASLHAQRQALIDALKIDLVSPQQPTTFWYVGGPGTVQVSAVMDAGLGFDLPPGQFTESPGIRFVAFDPFFYATTDQGTALSPRTALGSTNYVAWRDPLGRWGTMGASGTTVQLTGAAAAVYSLLPFNGTVLIGGRIGTAMGTYAPAVCLWYQSTNRFGTLTGGTISASAGGAGNVFAFSLLQQPNGSIVIGGDFGTAGGTRAFALTTWNGAFGTLVGGTLSANAVVQSMAYNGTLVVGGNFDSAAGTWSRSIALHVNNAWGTLTGGTVDNVIDAVLIGLDKRIYTAGNFSRAGGTAVDCFAFWNGAWGTPAGGGLAFGAGPLGFSLANAPGGQVYVGGAFTSASGGSANSIAQYNGVQMFPLGSGVQLGGGLSPFVYTMLANQLNNDLYVGGRFGTAGGVTVSEGLAVWNGATWVTPDIQIRPTGGTIYAVEQSTDGTIYIGGNFTGTAHGASVATIVNSGRTETYPVLRVRATSGTARLYQIENTLIGASVRTNYTLQAGEEVTFDTSARTLVSSYAGNIFSAILPGSNITTWRLMPGTNWVSFFSDTDALAVSLVWRPKSYSADAGTAL